MICSKDDLDLNARYEPLGVHEEGATVTFFLRRNASGPLGFFKGLTGQEQIIEVDERTAFEFGRTFSSASPHSLAQSDSAYAFDHAGASIQKVKLGRGLTLDCPQHSYVSSIIEVGRYSA